MSNRKKVVAIRKALAYYRFTVARPQHAGIGVDAMNYATKNLPERTRRIMNAARRAAWNQGRVVLFRGDSGRLTLFALRTAEAAHRFAGNVGGIIPRSTVSRVRS